ncbi:MAG: branched-chain amino acid ABC transporter permease, partial [Dehalococcoidia bacterium]|nr:branched-chain amino acid ABC transporter permease [Dehalococcoidia bacterium]
EFAVPLVFLALVVPTLRSRPALAAAGTAAIVATVAAGLPNGLNIITGALAGIVVGSVLNR